MHATIKFLLVVIMAIFGSQPIELFAACKSAHTSCSKTSECCSPLECMWESGKKQCFHTCIKRVCKVYNGKKHPFCMNVDGKYTKSTPDTYCASNEQCVEDGNTANCVTACTSKHHYGCCGYNICSYDSCGKNEGIVKSCSYGCTPVSGGYACTQCSKDSHCEDGNVCTKDWCITGQCAYVTTFDGSISCGTNKVCIGKTCTLKCDPKDSWSCESSNGNVVWKDCNKQVTGVKEYCQYGCYNGSCKPKPICSQYASKGCQGNVSTYLDCNGNPSVAIETCPYGCSNGSCNPKPVCSQYVSKACKGNTLTYLDCNGNPSVAIETCQYGCASASCLPKPYTACVKKVCSGTSVYCVDSNGAMILDQNCNGKKSSDTTTCEGNKLVTSHTEQKGVCVQSNGGAQCSLTQLTLVKTSESVCTHGCKSDACVVCKTSCTPQEKFCVGSEYKTCLVDQDGCPYWTEMYSSCPFGQTCVLNQCVAVQSKPCIIDFVTWGSKFAKDNDQVPINIFTKGNCDGVQVVVTIFEEDLLPFADDKTGNLVTTLGLKSPMMIPWKAVWIPDEDKTNPEYFLMVSVAGQTKKSLNTLIVEPTFSYKIGTLGEILGKLPKDGQTCSSFDTLTPACVDLAISGGEEPILSDVLPKWLNKENVETALNVSFVVSFATCLGGIVVGTAFGTSCPGTLGGGCVVGYAIVAGACALSTGETAMLEVSMPAASLLAQQRLVSLVAKVKSSGTFTTFTKYIGKTFASVKAVTAKGEIVDYVISIKNKSNGLATFVGSEFRYAMWRLGKKGEYFLILNSNAGKFFVIKDLTFKEREFVILLMDNDRLFYTYKIWASQKSGKLPSKVFVTFENEYFSKKPILGVNSPEFSPLKEGFFYVKGPPIIRMNLKPLVNAWKKGENDQEMVYEFMSTFIHEVGHSEQWYRAYVQGVALIKSILPFKRHSIWEYLNEHRILKKPGDSINLAKLEEVGYKGDLLLKNRSRLNWDKIGEKIGSDSSDFTDALTYWYKKYQKKEKDQEDWSLVEFYDTAELVDDIDLMSKIKKSVEVNGGNWEMFLNDAKDLQLLGDLWATLPYDKKTDKFVELNQKFSINVMNFSP